MSNSLDKEKRKETHLKNLNNSFSFSQSNSSHICIIADRGVKDKTTTAISHIWQNNAIMHKQKLYATNITSTEAEIMSMCLGLEQALHIVGVQKITVITDAIHRAQKIFDMSLYPYPTLIILIIEKIYQFFAKSPNNNITIWHCPSSYKWKPHKDVDREVKLLRTTPILSSKESWDFSKKSECKDLLSYWKIFFQASNRKGCNFLDLDDDNEGKSIEPHYKKSRVWLKYFGHTNSTCTRMTRLITNHTPIGEYRKRFFPLEESLCQCGIGVEGLCLGALGYV